MSSQSIDLFTRSWGEGSSRALLLHGLSSSSAGWWRVGPDLAELGFSVTAPDLRGHGATGRAELLDGSIDGYVADVLALGGGWDVVLGHSLGGRVAFDCQLADPSFAQVLVLEDPALFLPADPDVLAILTGEYDTEPTVAAFRLRYPKWPEQDVAAKVEALRQSSAEVILRTVPAITEVDHWPRLRDVSVPVLVLGAHPDVGGLVPPEIGERVAAQPNVTYVGIDDAGHSIHRDDYEAFWSALTGYLRRVAAVSG